MTRREYMPGQVGGGISSFQGVAQPGAPTVRPTDYSGIRSALDAWAVDTFQQREAEVMQRMQDRAAIEQTAMGVSGVVEAPDLARRYQQAFDQRARTVYDQQIKTDAISTANTLVRQHRLDPQGFNASWGEYIQSTTSAIKDSDPALAAGVETYLAGVGAQFSNQLEENVFQRELETQAAELVSLYDKHRVAYRDLILNNPDEALVEQAIAETTQILIEADAAAVLSPDAIRRMVAAIRDDYYEEFVRGSATQYFAAEDYKGVEFLINELETGKWFDDNGKARQLANQFRNQLPKPEGMSSGQIRLAANVARDIFSAVKLGAPIAEADYKRLERARDLVLGYGSETDIDTFDRYMNGIHTAARFLPWVKDASGGDLGTVIESLTTIEAVQQLPPGYADTLIGMANEELSRRTQAYKDGDFAALGLSAFRETPFAELAMASDEQRAQLAQVQEANREVVSSDLSMAVQTSPFWTHQHTRDAVDMIKASMERGDAESAFRIANFYMAPYINRGETMAGARAVAAVDPEVGGTLLMAKVLSGVDGRPAAQWFNLALEGRSIDSRSVDTQLISIALQRNRNALLSLAGNELSVYGHVSKAAEYMLRAVEVQGENPREALDNMLSRVNTVELSNGAILPASDFGDGPEEQRIAIQAVNEAIAELQDLGVRLDYENITPKPAGDGQFILRNVQMGTIVRDAGGDVFRISLTPDQLEAVRQTDNQTLQAMHEAHVAYMENQLQLSNRDRDRAMRVGDAAGLSEMQTRNVWRAINTTPAAEMTRLPNGIAPEVLDSEYIDIARRTARPDVTGRPQRITNTETQRYATFVYYADLLKEFNGDERKALAALHAGVSDVQFAIDVNRDAWESAMDKSTRAFIYRALSDD